MTAKKTIIILILPIALFLGSCSGNSSKADEPEVAKMDSIAKELEKTNKELDEKTKSLEAALEKVDKELETAK